MRRILCLISAVVVTASALCAAPNILLPFDGVAQGHEVVVPVTLRAVDDLAGAQCDVQFDAARLVCTGAVEVVSAPPGVLVDGEQIQPGRFRLLAYSPTGETLTNNVVCNLRFAAPTNALNGQAPLGSGTVIFGNSTGGTNVGTVGPGMILVGDAFALWSSGGRAQFRAETGSNFVIQASENLTTWTALTTNTAVQGLVWTVDPNALVLPKRFYRSAAAQ